MRTGQVQSLQTTKTHNPQHTIQPLQTFEDIPDPVDQYKQYQGYGYMWFSKDYFSIPVKPEECFFSGYQVEQEP